MIRRQSLRCGRKSSGAWSWEAGAWSIDIPRNNVLTKAAAEYLSRGIASDPEAVRRLRTALDMPRILEISEKDEVYLAVEEWVNKTLNFRRTEIRYDDPGKEEPDYVLETWLPAYSIGDLMAFYFPWLDYSYASEIEEYSGEVAEHKLLVELNELGKSLLVVEQFYRRGPEERDLPEPPISDEDAMSDEEWLNYQINRSVERDPY